MAQQETSKTSFSCPICSEPCTSAWDLEYHTHKKHPNIKATQAQSRSSVATLTPRQIQPQTTQQEELIIEYNLAQSKQGLGELDSVKVAIINGKEEIVDGFHRTGENQTWRKEVLPQIDTPEKLELARLAINFVRRKVTDQELTERLTFLVKSGMKPDEIAKVTGIHIRKIYRHLPLNLKSEKSQKISEGMKAQVDKRKLQNVSSSITSPDKHEIDLNLPLGSAPPQLTKSIAATTEPEQEEPIPEGYPLCPFCGSSMNLDEFEEAKQSATKKFGKEIIQNLLAPEGKKQ